MRFNNSHDEEANETEETIIVLQLTLTIQHRAGEPIDKLKLKTAACRDIDEAVEVIRQNVR